MSHDAPFAHSNFTTMANVDLFPGAVQLGPSVYLYAPPNGGPSGISAPKVLILCTWMNARPVHIKKYIDGYQALFPATKIILIRSSTPDVTYRSTATLQARVEPAVAVIRAACAQEPSSPEVLLHVFSNGGSHQSITLLRTYQSTTGHVFPIHAKILDSCPGRGNFSRSYLALSEPLARQPIYVRFLGSMAVFLALCFLGVSVFLLRIENPIETIRQGLNDRKTIMETKRVYIYSDADPMVHWQEVEDHADDARIKGYTVQLEKFEGSGHAAHVRVGGGERYWRIVENLWTQSPVAG